MFPTIYGVALQGLGEDTKFGAAGLVMAILGGAHPAADPRAWSWTRSGAARPSSVPGGLPGARGAATRCSTCAPTARAARSWPRGPTDAEIQRRLRRAWPVAAALGLGVAACGDDEEQVTVGLIIKQDTNPFFVTIEDTAKETADDDNVELLTAAGKSDVDNESQVAALEDMTARGAKGILITPADSTAVVPAIEKARQAGVTVIALDTPTDPESAVDALFATDNRRRAS